MTLLTETSAEDLTDKLAYAGLVSLAYELLKGMVIAPIKSFYAHTIFSGGPFVSYEHDVISLHNKSEFQACLFYLRDFMQVISSEDIACIQNLRDHRNELLHNLPKHLPSLRVENYAELFRATDSTILKLSNHLAYMEKGANPTYKDLDWNNAKGDEYLLYEEVLEKMQRLRERLR